MHINLINIKLLAFVVLFKKYRRNSLFYKNEKKYLTAKALGISPATFSKYVVEIKKIGLITEHPGCLKLAKLTTCIQTLTGRFNNDFSAFKYVRFFAGVDYENVNFKSICQQINIQIVKLNITSQDYKVNIIKSAISILKSNRFQKGKTQLLKKASAIVGGMSKLKSIDPKLLHNKTGKYHLSKLLGCSPSTGLNRLRSWSKLNLIKRTIVKVNLNIKANHSTFDLLKDKYKYLLINSKGDYYIQAGSTVYFN